jgi:hypothetical protein
MNVQLKNRSTIEIRITALWIICEAFAGGIIHALKIPISGLVVGGSAVICICLLGWHAQSKTQIIKSTLIVAIFKMMLSPQSPPMAYLAVFFQGALGQLMLQNKRAYVAKMFAFAMLALLESGVQRVLVMTLVYGKDLWQVINEVVSKLFKLKQTHQVSQLLIFIYLLLHLAAGFLAAYAAKKIITQAMIWRNRYGEFIFNTSINESLGLNKNGQQTIKIPWKRILLAVAMLAVYLNSLGWLGTPLVPLGLVSRMLIRAIAILALWYWLLGPLVQAWLKKWLAKQKKVQQTDINYINELLPSIRLMVSKSWTAAKQSTSSTIRLFIIILCINLFNIKDDAP